MLLIAIIAGLIGFVIGMGFLIQGPPYVPSDDDSAAQMLRLIKQAKPKRILDMGSGDGKLVIMLARAGYQVDGVELNPWLVYRSRRRIRQAGLTGKAHISWGNFWSYDVSPYDLVTVYAIKHVMGKLEQKLRAQLPKHAQIVSNYFIFPTLKPVKSLSRAHIYKI